MDVDPAATVRDEPPAVVAGLAAAGFADAEEVGRGGFGVVYRCVQDSLDRVVAVKVLTETLADDRARFVREQQAIGRLTGHPNIVPVFQVGEIDGQFPFLVMPFCGRGSVHERIARLGVLPLDEMLRIGVKIAGALATAHRRGIVHRDVKPANILLTDYGEPALCDFGIARISGGFRTATGTLAGSPGFTAPEVVGGAPPTEASDVYGLGATLFAALTGHAAFERRAGEKVVAHFVRIASEPIPDLREQGIDPDVTDVINVAMARDPARRPSALELGRRLQRVQASHGMPVDEMAVHDVGVAGGPDAVSAAGAPVGRRPRGNLPAPLAGLVGRTEELANLEGLLRSSRLVSVTGTGGIGKTALATYAAWTLAPDFPDGVWLVELADLRDGSLLADVIATALGLRDQTGHSPAEVVAGFLAPRRGLLVLDNCEHLVDQVAKLAEALLRDCPALHILATSREVLGTVGEVVLPLAPLAVPAPGDVSTLDSLADFEAVALFLERARAALPGFALTAANADPVRRICTRLEGLPLALELAAAWARALSVEQIAEGLADRFALLTRGRRGASSRQQTLAGCIDWSYQLCAPAEQRLWARLSVFAGTFDLPAAQHVCAGELNAWECLNVLGTLVDKSIVVRSEADGGSVRFRLLETLRDYGGTLLSDNELHEIRRRHADWYQRLSSQAAAEWYGPEQVRWLHRLAAEMPNIREALQFWMTDDPVVALQMVTNAGRFWQIRGMISEGRQWLDQAMNAVAPAPTRLRIRGLYYAALAAAAQGDFLVAQTRIAEGRGILETIDDPECHALIDAADGAYAMFSGDLERCRDCYRRAADHTDDYEVKTTSMYYLGVVLGFLGFHDEAMSWHEKAFALAESRGDPLLRACAENSLGLCLWRLGESERAEQLLLSALHSFAMLNETWVSAYTLETLAWIAGARGETQRSVVLMAAASAHSNAAGTLLFLVAEMAAWHGECERRARAELGPVEFDNAWARGKGLSLAEAAAFAMEGGDTPAHT